MEGTLLQRISEGVVRLDTQGRVLVLNRAASRQLGIRADWAQGRKFQDLAIPRELRDCVESALGLARPPTASITLRSGRVVECASFQEAEGTTLLLRDVTAEERVRQLRQHCLHIVTHEMRTPLTALNNFLSIWERTGAEPGDPIRSGISQQIDRLLRQVDKLVMLARLEGGVGGEHAEPFLALAPVQEAVLDCADRATSRGVTLHLSDESSGLAQGDQEDFRRAVCELIEYGLEAEPAMRKVQVHLTRIEREVVVSVRHERRSPELQAAAGQPPAGSPAPGPRGAEGLGLGLALAKRIARVWGGDLECEGLSDQGIQFRLCFPAAGPREVDSQPPAAHRTEEPIGAPPS